MIEKCSRKKAHNAQKIPFVAIDLECGGSTPPSTGRLDGPPPERGASSRAIEKRCSAFAQGYGETGEPPHSILRTSR